MPSAQVGLAIAAITSLGQPGPDFAGFGGADRRVAGEGFLPMLPGLAWWRWRWAGNRLSIAATAVCR
jgi:hypothetical protein